MSGLYRSEYGQDWSGATSFCMAARGYNEIQNPPLRYALINREKLIACCDIETEEQLRKRHRQWIEESIHNCGDTFPHCRHYLLLSKNQVPQITKYRYYHLRIDIHGVSTSVHFVKVSTFTAHPVTLSCGILDSKEQHIV